MCLEIACSQFQCWFVTISVIRLMRALKALFLNRVEKDFRIFKFCQGILFEVNPNEFEFEFETCSVLGDVLATVLALYMHDEDQPLPSQEEVLICTPETTTEEVT